MERNYSLDVFRIFSMLLIITLHILGSSNMGGGILIDSSSTNYYIGWLFETFAFCGVNCFAMLSGYLCIYKTKMNYKRIMDIWGLLFFYSVLFLLISYPLYNITNKDIYKSVLPLTSRVDWFTTSYFGLFMIMPFINKALINCNQIEFKKLLFICSSLFVILPLVNFNRIDLFMTSYGYSFLWLCVMYCFGAYQRMFPTKIKHSVLILFISTILAYCSKFTVLFLLNKLNVVGHDNLSMILIGYTSPFMVINAYILLNYFANKKITLAGKISNFVVFLSSVSFAVLMIHTNQCAIVYLLKDRLEFLKDVNFVLFIVAVPLFACVSYCIFTAIEGIRRIIFHFTRLELLLDKIKNVIIDNASKIVYRIIKTE